MRTRRTSSVICFGVALALSGALKEADAQSAGPPRGKPIDFSSPASSQTSTNLNQLREQERRRERLRQFEEETFGAARLFSPGGSLDGAAIIQPMITRKMLPRKKQDQDRLDPDTDWMLMNAKDLFGNSDSDDSRDPGDSGNGKDGKKSKKGKNKDSLSVEDLYFLELARKSGSAFDTERLRLRDFKDRDKAESDNTSDNQSDLDSDQGPDARLKSAERLQSLLGSFDSQPSDSKPQSGALRDSFADFFGLGQKNAAFSALDQNAAHDAYMEEFKRMSGYQESAAGLGLASPFKDAPKPFTSFSGVSGLYSSPFSAEGLDSAMKAVAPAPKLGVPDLNSGLGSPITAPILPKTALPARPIPQAPTFSVPRPAF